MMKDNKWGPHERTLDKVEKNNVGKAELLVNNTKINEHYW